MWLAVDLVRLSVKRDVDHVVVVSSDTDLVSALEAAVELRGTNFVEVAGWSGPGDSAPVLSVAGVKQHLMDKAVFDRVCDPTDYNIPLRQRRRSSWNSQIEAEGRRRRDSR